MNVPRCDGIYQNENANSNINQNERQLRSTTLSHTSIIAIVDDDQAHREALEDLVRSCGYESKLFSSAEEYLSYGLRATIDCMLVDVKMSGLSGIELQKKLNKEPKKPPMIFITSYWDDRTRKAVMDGGAFGFLGKPVDIDMLINCMETAIKHLNTPQ